ncbi:MAG: HAD-IB family phosphatase [Candidatus Marinimicrobia bacterium]|nr:HAD-IB family phosphatase [Candidatus Neomarinimicrobiota bacterium]
MIKNNTLFIDFDSTFIKVETLDILADIVMKNDTDAQNKKKLISDITILAMSGDIDFQTALHKRLNILSFTKNDILKVIERLSQLISDSIIRNKEFFQVNANNIWIISGGFKEIITPIVAEYGILPHHVIANSFIFNGDKIIGCDESQDLYKEKGKIKAIHKLNINSQKIMIGDGYTDYEVFSNGEVNHFICYTENIIREKVRQLSTLHANSFDDVLRIIEEL